MAGERERLDLSSCQARQHRFAKLLGEHDLDVAILTRPENIQYFTGYRGPAVLQSAMLIDANGRSCLCAPNTVPEYYAANEVCTYEAQWTCTLRQDQAQAAWAALLEYGSIDLQKSRLGVEQSQQTLAMTDSRRSEFPHRVDIEPLVWQMRRRKDADELAMIRRAIACNDAMYQRARHLVRPGLSELDLYCQLHAAGVEAAGEPLMALGNDFQCASPGGPPRPRKAEAGELWILDLGPCVQGYYADSCRTFSVDGTVSPAQRLAWQTIVDTLDMVEQTVRPGVSARALYQEAMTQLHVPGLGHCFHHLGHGFGLTPHEGPHLNDRWDDVFEEGDVFTAEPGLYDPVLKAGIRLEQNYLVTASGIERLTSFPLDL